MSAETLFTAARRAVRFFNIDMNKGGLITPETEHAIGLLNRQVQEEAVRQKADANGDEGEGVQK